MNLINTLYNSDLLHIILIYVVGITILLSLGLSQTKNPKIFLLSILKSKNKRFNSVTVPIVREYKDKYLVEYRGKIMFVNK